MSDYEKNLSRLSVVAEAHGLIFNPDGERVEKVVGLMTDNMRNHGLYFCPCKRENDPPKVNVDPVCPCIELSEEIAKDGHCFCRLFYTPQRADEQR
ncbi:hypothetical protein GF402_06715 [Candidatus Fermentibacteria bacterium]|nr:hypothetical protein [Candidatus Fermentibacteria bacterium]